MAETGTPPRWQLNLTTAISALALVVSISVAAIQWREGHQQWLLSIKPHINFDTTDDPDAGPAGIAIQNAGPGPAIIKSLTYYVDRKPVQDADEAVTYGKVNSAIVDYHDLEPGDTLAVGETFWLLQYQKPRKGTPKPKDIDDLMDFMDEHVAVLVVFCSVDDQCYPPKCSTKDRC